ncbi:MAG: succinylglutamate desuccinylase/aspartoacylase family protein [Gaiellaceae bacterium]|jgi:predicted deacylase
MGKPKTVVQVPAPEDLTPGRHLFWLTAGSAPNVDDSVPVIVHRGEESTPSMAIVAGVHGDEVEGMRAVHMIDRELARRPPAGSTLLIPTANPAAFRAGARRHPGDLVDLNRSFPGDPNGSVSLRLAARLFETVGRWGFVLSLHSWFSSGSVTPYVEVPAGGGIAEARSKAVAELLGLDLVRLSDWHPGLLVASALRIGVPAVEVEVGGLGRLAPEYRGRCLQIVRYALAAVGVIDGATSTAATDTYRHHYLPASCGGYFTREVELRERVRPGQRVGAVVDPFGHTRQVVRAIQSGLVVGYRDRPAVYAGDNLIYVFTPASASDEGLRRDGT